MNVGSQTMNRRGSCGAFRARECTNTKGYENKFLCKLTTISQLAVNGEVEKNGYVGLPAGFREMFVNSCEMQASLKCET